MSYFLLTLLMFVGLFLIAVILLQRGRGGGLAGAFGGLGGQSAFGTRAGDMFTWITVVTVILWVVLAAVTGRSMRADQPGAGLNQGDKDEVSVSEDPDVETSKGSSKKNDGDDLGLPDFNDFPVGPAKNAKPEGAPLEAGKPGAKKADDEEAEDEAADDKATLSAPPDDEDKSPEADLTPQKETSSEPTPQTDAEQPADAEKPADSEPAADSDPAADPKADQ